MEGIKMNDSEQHELPNNERDFSEPTVDGDYAESSEDNVESEIPRASLENEQEAERIRQFEKLQAVADSAMALEPLMSERYEGKFSRKFMSPAQAGAFSHALGLAAESLKAGDVGDFNQELKHITKCFKGYGENATEGVYEEGDSLRGISEKFADFKTKFADFEEAARDVPGIDTELVGTMSTYFDDIHNFHEDLYGAFQKFTQSEDVVLGSAESKAIETKDEEIETGINPEKRVGLSKMLEDVSNDARAFGGNMKQRYDDNLTIQPMSLENARSLVSGIESATDAVKSGNNDELTTSLQKIARSFNGYGDGRGTARDVRESFDNVGSFSHNFLQLKEGFARFSSAYTQEEGSDPDVAALLVRMNNGFNNVDDFNARLKGRARETFGR